MRLRRLATLVFALLLPAAVAPPALAQQEEEEKGWLVTYVEDTISTPDRRISLGRIEGALSSDVRISDITIADRQGVWLKINGAHLVWSRSALLSRRLEIDLLEAESIVVSRKPLPPEGVQPAASEPFAVPELPVSVRLGRLTVPKVEIAAEVAGQDTVLGVEGRAEVESGVGRAALDIRRLQPAGGELSFRGDFDNATRKLNLLLSLLEPKRGFLSTMLGIPGEPAVAFNISGTGTLDNFTADVGLAADGERLLGGKAVLAAEAGGTAFRTDLDGTLARLVDPAFSDFVAGSSTLRLDAFRAADGSLELRAGQLRSGVLDLGMSGRFSPEGFPLRFDARGTVVAASGGRVRLPASDTTIAGSRLAIAFGEGTWSADFDVDGVETATLKAERMELKAGGAASDLDKADARALTFQLTGRTQGVVTPDAGLQQVLGDGPAVSADGRWQAGQPLTVDGLKAEIAGGTAGFTGTIAGNDVDGVFTLAAPDLAAFSTLAGRPLRGVGEVAAKGRVALVGGALSLTLDGRLDGASVGEDMADRLLRGRTTLAGGLLRDVEGLHFSGFEVANDQVGARIDGDFGPKALALKLAARLTEVGLVTDKAGGRADLSAELAGPAEAPKVNLELASDNLVLQGKPFRGARARFAGTVAGADVDGDFRLDGVLDRLAVAAAARLESAEDGTRSLHGLKVTVGGADIAGDLSLRPDGLAAGKLRADIPNLADIAPLLLLRAAGTLSADIALGVEGGTQNASVKARARSLEVDTVRVSSADIDIAATDLRGVPGFAGSAAARGIALGGFVVTQLQAKASRSDGASTVFDLSAGLPRGNAATRGAITPAGDGFDLRLDSLSLRQDGIALALARPVTLARRAGDIRIPGALLRIGQGGTVSIDGTVGDRLDLEAVVTRLPLSLANAFSPGLGAAGTLSATARIGGTPAVHAADFTLRGDGLTVQALRQAGVPVLALTGGGRYADNAVTLDASVSGAGGLTLRADGRVPLAGAGLAVDVTGSVPLALANSALRDRAAKLTGTVAVAARVTGSIGAPQFGGHATVSGGTLTDPLTGTRLTGMSGVVRLAGQRAIVERFSAVTQGGGTLGLGGSVGLAGDLPADLAVTLRNAKLSDGSLAVVQLSGDLTVRGALLVQPVIGGRITIHRAEITIPERFAANAALLGVKHLSPPPAVRRTLAKLGKGVGKGAGKGRARRGGGGGSLVLDITIDAPGRIFVRGRGVDAELGGQLTLRGPISNVSPVGSFRLRRGSVDVIGQHITLDSGEVMLLGDLNPTIDFAATTRSSAISVTARITGQALDPEIVLSSTPELPQDEVLAQFLFKRSIDELSPVQIVQLATAVAQLAGGSSGPGLLGSIRKSTGLDTLSVVTDEKGNAAVQAGRYIGENIYLGVTAGAGGETRGTINLDVTRSLKLRGEAGTDGGKAGIYYEREY